MTVSPDSCPKCGSAEILAFFQRSSGGSPSSWNARCSDCLHLWAEADEDAIPR
jgi:DNA-directed RNA polymerase subunit M/transcription elongation factor TFIIS